ncbi:universal stress protein [Halomonas sp. KAO]|uniref:universal stress protein n=1 Tax=Halomonas sp. KAO TaxID=2783858 RepID=UPI0018A06358|nr:universal stress protein [Halomonas sp. KAO]MBF7054275.1 universal stress protein [Halomonas sp. KAO]
MYAKILVPLDGSEHAIRALRVAAALARDGKATLHLMTVAGSPPDSVGLFVGGSADPFSEEEREQMAQAMRDKARKVIDQARSLIDLDGLDVKESVSQGHPAEQIKKQAATIDADVIVMGSRGLGNVRGMMFGSVSHKVSHIAGCGVITVT